jgi:hypothetical protein
MTNRVIRTFIATTLIMATGTLFTATARVAESRTASGPRAQLVDPSISPADTRAIASSSPQTTFGG